MTAAIAPTTFAPPNPSAFEIPTLLSLLIVDDDRFVRDLVIDAFVENDIPVFGLSGAAVIAGRSKGDWHAVHIEKKTAGKGRKATKSDEYDDEDFEEFDDFGEDDEDDFGKAGPLEDDY